MESNLFRIGKNWTDSVSKLAREMRQEYTINDMKEFQHKLNNRAILLLKEYFTSFTWMDGSKIKVIGSTPQYYVIARTSDGTYNLLRGLPVHSCSISFMKKKDQEPTLSLIKDTFRGDTFVADQNETRLNKKKIKTSETKRLTNASLSIDPRDVGEKLKEALVFRRLGSFSLEIAWLASGGFDCLIQPTNLNWSYFPATLHVLQKAGGKATNIKGEPIKFKLDINGGSNIIASANETLHERILEKIKKR